MLAALFTLFVIFLYGPMIASHPVVPGAAAALVFPLRDPSLIGSTSCSPRRRTGDVVGAFYRSLPLALIVMVLTVLISVTAGFAFRRRFKGATVIFYTAIASLIVPGLVLASASSSPSAISAVGDLVHLGASARIFPGRCPSAC